MNENSNYRKSNVSQNYLNKERCKDNLRVLCKKLLFCSGLLPSISAQQLKSSEYFGKYGTVIKVTLLKSMKQMSAYLTFKDPLEASLAIIANKNFQLDKLHKLAPIYGTIKYCKFFLKKIQCKNLPNCNYLHVFDKKNQIIVNNQLPDEVFEEHYKIAVSILKSADLKKIIKEKNLIENKQNDVLPCPIKTLNSLMRQNIQDGIFDSDSKDSKQEPDDSQQTYQSTAQTPQSLDSKQYQISRIEKLQVIGKKQSISQSQKRDFFDDGIKHSLNLSQSLQSLQIKLIRKILREPRSKLMSWKEIARGQVEVDEVKLFHKGLGELNQLCEMFQNDILRQLGKEQERVKFLLIKKIHQRANCPKSNRNISHIYAYSKPNQNNLTTSDDVI